MFTPTTTTNAILPFKDAFARHYPLPAPLRTWGGLGCAAVLSAVDLVSGASGAKAVERILRTKLEASIIAAQEAHLEEIWNLGGRCFDFSVERLRSSASFAAPVNFRVMPGENLHGLIFDKIVPDDDESQPGDVEAALARLEGRVDPRVQAKKNAWANERMEETLKLRRQLEDLDENRKRVVRFADTAEIKHGREDDVVSPAERPRTVKVQEDGRIDWWREGFMGRVLDEVARQLARDGELSERTVDNFEELGIEIDAEGMWYQVGECDLGDGLEEEEAVEDGAEDEAAEEVVDPALSCAAEVVEVVDFPAYEARAHANFNSSSSDQSDEESVSEGDDSGYSSGNSDCGEFAASAMCAHPAEKAKGVAGGWFSSWFAYEQSTGSSELHTRIADIACSIY